MCFVDHLMQPGFSCFKQQAASHTEKGKKRSAFQELLMSLRLMVEALWFFNQVGANVGATSLLFSYLDLAISGLKRGHLVPCASSVIILI